MASVVIADTVRSYGTCNCGKQGKWFAFGVVMIPGVLKEIADSSRDNGHFSGKDLAADALGVHLGHWIVTTRGVGYRAAF